MVTKPHAAFGDLLRHARRNANLTQDELAERAGISTRTISDLERGISRAPQQGTLDMLAGALNLSSEEQTHWRQARKRLAARSASPPSKAAQSRTHLPAPLTTFVGREQEIIHIANVLRGLDTRLMTLTGVGGVGKTRLALMVVRQIADAFPDGVWFVDLAPLSDPNL
ncbi:MAG: XRE family transcriptional regulator, partial [Chloroflexia bacterium]|nr:XRE family transcriptional regulator [Chloroflexia bacterium]